ncbi:hypothetical protein [Bradyrhizobium sp. HKCCYLS20291]|uniref:hypothetical protein n=1 Tax=Bradyrhizobium sp. HKCCYLS20291 TaxID=3420766 RepID=UPI003EB73F31
MAQENNSTAKSISEIILIGSFGEATAIGDPDFGDPHKEHGLLSHTYPKTSSEEQSPLFVLEPETSAESMRVTLMTTVPFEKLCLLPGNTSERVAQLARTELEQRADEAVEAHEILRQQMLRDELTARVARNQREAGLPVREGEFVVMIEIFEIRPTTG